MVLLTCEHGGNEVPPELAPCFEGAAEVLNSHRGMDFGALEVVHAFGVRLGSEPITATVTRLVVDLNRSPHHRNVVSEFTRGLDPAARRSAMEKYYWPYRNAVEQRVATALEEHDAFVLHVSSHSFTPVLNGVVRNCDVGLLYDPASGPERAFMDGWHEQLGRVAPHLVVRRNYPYRGISDALVTYLRKRFGRERYAGVELEVNQKHVGTREWPTLVTRLTDTVEAAVAAFAAEWEAERALPRLSASRKMPA